MTSRLEILGGAPEVRGPLQLDAVLRPNRSLSMRGFNRLMMGLGLLSFTVGAVFLLNGAWPVLGFFGLEVLVVWFAFRASYKQGRLFERVRVAPEVIHVQRVWPNGATRHWAVNPFWARVEHEKDGPNADAVRLAGGDKRVALGRFLAPEERVSFASALRDAIAKARRGPAQD
jgi:uncharacterized membrane protein